jgi:hypothetical protein
VPLALFYTAVKVHVTNDLKLSLSSNDAGDVSSQSVMLSPPARIKWMRGHACSNITSGAYSKRHMQQIHSNSVCCRTWNCSGECGTTWGLRAVTLYTGMWCQLCHDCAAGTTTRPVSLLLQVNGARGQMIPRRENEKSRAACTGMTLLVEMVHH